jgi:hypothetical protein
LASINAPAGKHDIPAYYLEYYAQEQNSYTHQNGFEICDEEVTDRQRNNALSDEPL